MKTFWLITCIFTMLIGCRVHSGHTLQSSREQCQILAKKRVHQANLSPRLKHKRTSRQLVAKQNTRALALDSVVALQESRVAAHGLPDATPAVSEPTADTSFHNEKPLPEKRVKVEAAYNHYVTHDAAPRLIQRQSDQAYTSLPLIIGLSGVMCLIFFHVYPRVAYRMAAWGKENPRKARGILFAGHSSIIALAFMMGRDAYAEGLIAPSDTLPLFTAITFAAAVTYPMRGQAWFGLQNNFRIRKSYDIVLCTAGTILMMLAGNQNPEIPILLAKENPPFFSQVKTQASSLAKATETKPIYIKTGKPKSTGTKVLLTVITAVAFTVLIQLVGSLACNISCSGNVVLGNVIFIAGGAALITLLVITLRGIYRKDRGDGAKKESES